MSSENLKTNIDIQFYIYKYLDRANVLFEFLYRAIEKAEPKSGIVISEFSKHILEDIQVNNPFPGNNTIKISTEISKSNPTDIYIIVKFKFENAPPNQTFGHMTFHLLNNVINPTYGDGPLHIVNERSDKRRQKLRLRKIDTSDTYKGLVFSIGGCKVHKCTVGEPLPQLALSVINVLNRYFNPTDALSLLNKIDPSHTDSELHSLVRYILNYNIGRRGGGRRTKRNHKRSKYNLSHTRKKE
jgi:hypothetical protein